MLPFWIEKTNAHQFIHFEFWFELTIRFQRFVVTERILFTGLLVSEYSHRFTYIALLDRP